MVYFDFVDVILITVNCAYIGICKTELRELAMGIRIIGLLIFLFIHDLPFTYPQLFETWPKGQLD